MVAVNLTREWQRNEPEPNDPQWRRERCRPQRSTPRANIITQAAAHHAAAAHHHLEAAHHHDVGEHEAAMQHAEAAHEHGEHAHKAAATAHQHSQK